MSALSQRQYTPLAHAGKLFGQLFFVENYSAIIHLIHFKFGTVKDIYIVNVSIVLDFSFFAVLAGK